MVRDLRNPNWYIEVKLDPAQDKEKFDFLAGEANIYFEGNYAGKSFIDPQATADSLNLSLGMDPNIIVKREKLENFENRRFLNKFP